MDMPVSTTRGGQLRWRTVVRPEWLIDAWLDLLPAHQVRLMRPLHEAVLAASTSLVPCVKWGNLVYVREGRAVAQLTPHRHAVHLQLPQARRSRSPRGPVRGPGPGTLRFRLSEDVDFAEITYQVVAALRGPGR